VAKPLDRTVYDQGGSSIDDRPSRIREGKVFDEAKQRKILRKCDKFRKGDHAGKRHKIKELPVAPKGGSKEGLAEEEEKKGSGEDQRRRHVS